MRQGIQQFFPGQEAQRRVFQAMHDVVGCFQGHRSECQRCQHSGELVAYAHDADAFGGCFRRPQDGCIRIGGCLQQCQPRSHQEQSCQEKQVEAAQCGWNEEQSSQCHDGKPDGDGSPVSDAVDHFGRRQGEDEVGDVKDESDKVRLEIIEFA